MCLRLVMMSEPIVVAALVLLNLSRTWVVYYEVKYPHVHRRGVAPPNGSSGPLGLLPPVPEALFSKVNRLRLFEVT